MPRRIFLPMDEVFHTGWTPHGHPQKKLNHPIFDSPHEAVSRLAKIASDLQAVLVLKPHPNQAKKNAFFDKASLPANVELYNGNLKAILEVADVVVCFLTKVAFSGLAIGKPVVTLAPNPAALSGLTFHCTSESDVAAQVRAAFDYEWTGSRRTKLAEFLGYLESEYFVANDLSNNGAKCLLERFFPEAPPPDPAAIEEAKMFLANIDHFKFDTETP
jgi:hypothetical protein